MSFSYWSLLSLIFLKLIGNRFKLVGNKKYLIICWFMFGLESVFFINVWNCIIFWGNIWDD